MLSRNNTNIAVFSCVNTKPIVLLGKMKCTVMFSRDNKHRINIIMQ